VAYAGSWVDPQKGKAIANAMIDQGVDVITHWADLTGLGALDAARERGIIALGGISDQLHYAPNIATSILLGVYDYIYWALSHYIEGDLQGGKIYEYGIKDGLKALGDWNTQLVPKEVIDKANEVTNKIKNGEIKVPLITKPTD
jgi:basic membrane protein A